MHYPAFVHKDEHSIFGVTFPDVPGCTTAEASLDLALESAAEVLALHLAEIEAAGMEQPEPRSLDAVLDDLELGEDRARAALVLVPYRREEDEAVLVDLPLDSRVLGQIDEAAASQGISRSRWIADRARQAVAAGARSGT